MGKYKIHFLTFNFLIGVAWASSACILFERLRVDEDCHKKSVCSQTAHQTVELKGQCDYSKKKTNWKSKNRRIEVISHFPTLNTLDKWWRYWAFLILSTFDRKLCPQIQTYQSVNSSRFDHYLAKDSKKEMR